MKLNFSINSGISFSLLLFIFITTNAQTILNKGDSCSETCKGTNSIYQFEDGQIYSYQFNLNQNIKNPNSDNEMMSLELTGTAKVAKISKCDIAMKLEDVVMTESVSASSKESKTYDDMKKLLEKESIRFGFDDGKISGVCPTNNDSPFIVNIKKAIISQFQVAMDKIDVPQYTTETDISGDCRTDYSLENTGTTTSLFRIKKMKVIAGCGRSNKFFSTFTGQNVEDTSETRKLAMLEGSHECNLVVEKGKSLKSVECKEDKILQLFSSNVQGSTLKLETSLIFQSMVKGALNSNEPTVRMDLTMEKGDKKPLQPMKMVQKTVRSSKEIIQSLCTEFSKSQLTTEATKLFMELQLAVTNEKYDTIRASISEINQCANKDRLKQMVLDAISNSQSEDALRAYVAETEANDLFGMSLGMVQYPTPDLIKTFQSKIGNSPKKLLLLSQMIESYCNLNPGCEMNPDLMNAMNFIVDKLGKDCTAPNNDEILYALRAISNMARVPKEDKLITILATCLWEKKPSVTKVFAVEALKQFPCSSTIDGFLLKVFGDESKASELRIQAYLSLMRCPTDAKLKTFLTTLTRSKCQQLGSFIWSHLNNLLSSECMHKMEIRELVQKYSSEIKKLSEKFNLDFRSYSKNYERTLRYGDIGVNIDSNMIFNPQSPIPAVASLNLTLALYGRRINLMDFNLRAENIYELFQNKFKGNKMPAAKDHEDVIKMDQKIPEPEKSKSITITSKFAGRQLYFEPDASKIMFTLMGIVNKEMTKERGIMIQDTIVSVATITGFPLEMQMRAAALTHFNFKSEFSKGQLRTRANVAARMVGSMQINGHCTKIGVQSETQMSVDEGFGGQMENVRSANEKEETVEFNFITEKIPNDRKLIFVKNELSTIHSLKQIETKAKFEEKINRCTSEGFRKLFGTQMCLKFDTSKTYGSFFPNIMGDLVMKEFKGIEVKMRHTQSVVVKNVRRSQAFMLSLKYPGENEEFFKIDIDRKKQMYELNIAKKYLYINLGMTDSKINGEYKYKKNSGKIDGTIVTKGLADVTVDVKIDTNKGPVMMNLEQTFAKSGPLIKMTIERKGESPFKFTSTNTLKLTKHKIYNFFQRISHNSKLVYGKSDDTLTLFIEHARANNPVIELRFDIQSDWTINKKKYYSLNEQLTIYKHKSVSPEIANSNGMNYTMTFFSKVEFEDKKLTGNYYFYAFKTNGFMDLRKPKCFDVRFLSIDKSDKSDKTLLEARYKFDANVLSKKKGIFKIHSLLKDYSGKLNSLNELSWDWNRRTFDNENTYDINGKWIYQNDQIFNISHIHQSLKKSSAQLNINTKSFDFKINSDISLPTYNKLNILLITKSDNFKYDYEIESKFTKLVLKPLNIQATHDLKRGNKLIITFTNKLALDTSSKTSKKVILNSKALNVDDKTIIYDINSTTTYKTNSKLYEISSKGNYIIPNSQLDNKYKFKKSIYFNTKKSIYTYEYYYFDSPKNSKIWSGSTISMGLDENMKLYTKGKYNKDNNETVSFDISYKRSKGEMKTDLIINLPIYLNTIVKYKSESKIKNGITKQKSRTLIKLIKGTNYQDDYYYKLNSETESSKTMYEMKQTGVEGKNEKDNSPINNIIKIKYPNPLKVNIYIKLINKLIRTRYELNVFESSFDYNFLNNNKYKAEIIVQWQNITEPTKKYYKIQFDHTQKNKKSGFNILSTSFLINAEKSKRIFMIRNTFENNKYKHITERLQFYTNSTQINIKLSGTKNKNNIVDCELDLTTNFNALQRLKLKSKWNNKSKSELYNIKHDLYTLLKKDDVKYKIDLNNAIEWSNTNAKLNMKWISNNKNIPSGELYYKRLNKNNMFTITSYINYNNTKNILSLNVTMKNNNQYFKINFKSNIITLIKLGFNYNYNVKLNKENVINLIDFKGNLYGYYDNKFIEIKNINITYNTNTRSMLTTKLNINSSYDTLNNIQIVNDINYKTYYFKNYIKRNKKVIDYFKIDYNTGTLKIDSSILPKQLYIYIKGTEIQNFQIKIKYEPFDLNIKYYRGDKGMDFKNVGKVYLYGAFDYQRGENIIYAQIYINNDKTSGEFKSNASIEWMKLKYDTVVFKIENLSKDDKNKYKGTALYNGQSYSLIYEFKDYDKQWITLTEIKKGSIPSIINIGYDITNDIKMELSLDKSFVFNIDIKSKDDKNKEGKLKIIYNSETYVDLNLKRKATLPKNNYMDNIKGYIKFDTGYDLEYNIDGLIGKEKLNSMLILYRMPSKNFTDGKHGKIEFMFDYNKIYFKTKVVLNRKWPQFELNNELLYKESDTIKHESKTKINYIDMENFLFNYKSNIEILIQRKIDLFKILLKMHKVNSQFNYYNKNSIINVYIDFEQESFKNFTTNIAALYDPTSPIYMSVVHNKDIYFMIDNDIKFNIKLTQVSEGIITVKYKTVDSVISLGKITNTDYYYINFTMNTDDENYKIVTSNNVLNYKSDTKNILLSSITKINRRLIYNIDGNLLYRDITDWDLKSSITGDIYFNLTSSFIFGSLFNYTLQYGESNMKISWSNQLIVIIKSEIKIELKHTRGKRIMITRYLTDKDVNEFILSWDKLNGNIIGYKMDSKSFNIYTPLRFIKFEQINNVFNLTITSPIDEKSKVIYLEIKLAEYSVDNNNMKCVVNFKSNMLQKEITLNVSQIMKPTGIEAILDLKNIFSFTYENIKFSDNGCRHLIKLNSGVKTAVLTMDANYNLAERMILLNASLVQTGLDTRRYVFEFKGGRKLLISINEEVKLLLERKPVGTGFKSNIILKLDKDGPNLFFKSTYTTNPRKYVAEIQGKTGKLVISAKKIKNVRSMKIYRSYDTKGIIIDGSLTVERDSNNVMKQTLYYNKEAPLAYGTYLYDVISPERVKTVRANMRSRIKDYANTLITEIKSKVANEFKVFDLLTYFQVLASDFENLPKQLANSYDTDLEYMKNILNVIRQMTFTNLQAIFNEFSTILENLGTKIMDYIKENTLYTKMINSLAKFIKYYIEPDRIKSCMDYMMNCCETLVGIVRNCLKTITDMLGYIDDTIQKVQDMTSTKFETIQNYLKNSLFYRILEIESQIFQALFDSFVKNFDEENLKQLKEYINESWKNIKEFKNSLSDLSKVLEYFPQNTFIGSMMNLMKNVASLQFKKAAMDIYQYDKMKVEFNKDRSEMKFQMYVSPLMKPRIMMARALIKYLPTVFNNINSPFGKDNKLVRMFYKYEYLLFIKDYQEEFSRFMPPFERTAYVLNGNSIITFDDDAVVIGTGPCTVLLARDIRFKSFSFSMQRVSKDEVIYTLEYFNTISFSTKTKRVQVNGKPINSLPITLTNNNNIRSIFRSVMILHTLNYIQIKTNQGLDIKYFMDVDDLQFNLQGDWHGSVKGLMGSNDFDKGNDRATPDGTVMSDSGKLVDSWKLGSCDSKTKTGLFMMRLDQKLLQYCYKPTDVVTGICKGKVDYMSYLDICKQNLYYKQFKPKEMKEFVCQLERNFIQRCQERRILARISSRCDNCPKRDKFGNSYSKMKSKNIKNEYTILVLDITNACIRNYKDVVENLVTTLGAKSMNRFSVIAVADRSNSDKPTLNTYNGQIVLDKSDTLKLLQEAWKEPSYLNYNPKRILSAISEALKLPGLQNNRKKIAVFACSQCAKNKKDSYSYLASRLKSKDIPLAYFTTQSFDGQGNNENMAGLSNRLDFVYKPDGSVKTIPKSNKIFPPKDECSGLALLNKGSVWSLKNMTTKQRIRRATDVASQRLMDKSMNKSMSCRCKLNKYQYGQYYCE